MAVKLEADASGFKREMDEAAKSVKALANESKLADSELRKSGDTQAYVAQKTAALTRQIEQQERAVAAAEKGLAAAAKQYGANSTQVQTWQSRLAAARTSLNNLQADLNEVTAGTDRMQRSLQGGAQATQQLGQIANSTKFTAFQSALNGVEQKMNQVSATARRVAQSVWRMATDSAEWADDLATNATRYGIDTRTLQQWEYAANFVDVSASTIASASNRLVSAVANDSQALANLGVSARTSADEMRSTQDVFWDSIEALSRMTDETERDAQAQALFGKSFAELRPLIEAGRQAWEDYCEEAERAGLVLSEDQVAALGSFHDSLDRMQASISSLTHGLMAELAPGFEAISGTVSDAVQSILEWTHTAEGQQAINNLTQSIQALVHSMADGGLQALIRGITDAITALGNAANWAAQHSDALMPLLTLAIGGSGAGRLAIGGLRIANGVRNLLGLGSGTAAASSTAAAASTAASAGTAATAAGGGLLATIGTGLAGFGLGVGTMSGLALLAREAGTVHHSTSAERDLARSRARLAEYGITDGSLSPSQEEQAAAWRRHQEQQAREEQEAVEAFNAAVEELVEGWRDSAEQNQDTDAAWRATLSEWAENLTQRDITDAIEAARIPWNNQQQNTEGSTPTHIEAEVGIAGEAITVALADGTISLHEYDAIVRYVNEHLTPALEEARAMIGGAWGEVAAAMQTWPTQAEFDAARPTTEREALEFLAMTDFVRDEMGADLEHATKLAGSLWVELITECGSPAAFNTKLGQMTGEQAAAANDTTFTAMTAWVERTMGVDHDTAIAMAKAMWDDMRRAATSPEALDGTIGYEGDGTSTAFQDAARDIFGPDYEAAMAMVKTMYGNLAEAGSNGGFDISGASINPNSQSSGLRQDVERLAAIKAEIERLLGEIGETLTEEYILSLDISDEDKAYLTGLIADADRIATRIGWYQSDEARAGAGAYEMAMQGIDFDENFYTALEYLNQMRAHQVEEVDSEIGRLSIEAREARTAAQQAHHELTMAQESGADADTIAELQAAYDSAHQAALDAEAARDRAIEERDTRMAEITHDYTALISSLMAVALQLGFDYTGQARPAPREATFTPTPWEQFVAEHPELVAAIGATWNEAGEIVPYYGTGTEITPAERQAMIEAGVMGPDGSWIFQPHGSTEDYWYGEGDSAGRQLGELYNNSFDEFAAAADVDEAVGAWFDDVMQAIREGGENAGLYDAILTAAFGDSWTSQRAALTGKATATPVGQANTYYGEGGYRDARLNELMGMLGFTAGSTQVTDITDAAKAVDKLNEGIRLFNAGNAEMQAEAEAAAATVDESALAGWDRMWEFWKTLVSGDHPAINQDWLSFVGGDYGPLENLLATAVPEIGIRTGGAQYSEGNESGAAFNAGFAAGVAGEGDPQAAAAELGVETQEALDDALGIESPSKTAMQTGLYVAQGFALGISAGTPEVVAAARQAAEAAAEAMREALSIHSPSQVMMALGAYVGEGFALGIAGAVDQVQAAVYGMAAATEAPLARAAAAGGNAYNSSSALYVDKYYQNSAEDIDYISRQLADMQQRQLMGYGHGR